MIYIVLPIFNEEKSLIPLLTDMEKVMNDCGFDYRIIAVNDGSSDDSLKILEQYQTRLPITIINHKINRGLGETIRDGFEAAAENADDMDIIIRLDSDYTHHPKYIPILINKMEEGYDVVICSRFQPGAEAKGLNIYRTFISMCANMFLKLFFPMKNVKEFSCGFRAYRMQYIKTAINIFGNSFIDLKGLGFTVTIEKLIKMRMLGARFAEIPFTLHYDKKMSESKMVTSVTTLGYIILVVKYITWWGKTGKIWKEKIEEFKRRKKNNGQQNNNRRYNS